MRQELFPPQERERRFRIIEAGVRDEFWKVLSDSMMAYTSMRSIEAIELSAMGKLDEAQRIAIEVEAIRRIIAEPTTIIRVNKPIFDAVVMEVCNACGHVAKKLKQIIKGKEETQDA